MMKNIIQLHREKLHNIDKIIGDNHDLYMTLYSNFIDYIEANPSTSYYPISRIIQASRCTKPAQALEIANYFSSGSDALLEITFCYFDFDGSEIIIDREEFIESLLNDAIPASEETGNPIDNFDPSRLGFFCNLRNIHYDHQR